MTLILALVRLQSYYESPNGLSPYLGRGLGHVTPVTSHQILRNGYVVFGYSLGAPGCFHTDKLMKDALL